MPFDLRKEGLSSLVQPVKTLPVVPGHAVSELLGDDSVVADFNASSQPD